MSLISLLFWGLVAATLVISLRWGAMIGLIVFVFALMLGAVAVSRWSPPKGAVSAGSLFFQAEAGQRPPISLRTSVFSMR